MDIFGNQPAIPKYTDLDDTPGQLDTDINLLQPEDVGTLPADSPLADPVFVTALADTHRQRMLAMVGVGGALEGSEADLLDEIGEPALLAMIGSGVSPFALANRLRMRPGALHAWIESDEGRVKRVDDAIAQSGWCYADKGKQVLLAVDTELPTAKLDLDLAKALSGHYRWMSGVADRKRFGQMNNQSAGAAPGAALSVTIQLDTKTPDDRPVIDIAPTPAHRQVDRGLLTVHDE